MPRVASAKENIMNNTCSMQKRKESLAAKSEGKVPEDPQKIADYQKQILKRICMFCNGDSGYKNFDSFRDYYFGEIEDWPSDTNYHIAIHSIFGNEKDPVK